MMNRFQLPEESLLDNSLFEEVKHSITAQYYDNIESALKEYFEKVHNLDYNTWQKQYLNTNNFRLKEDCPVRSYNFRGSGYTDYYFENERIFTIYSDGYVYYGGWRTL